MVDNDVNHVYSQVQSSFPNMLLSYPFPLLELLRVHLVPKQIHPLLFDI